MLSHDPILCPPAPLILHHYHPLLRRVCVAAPPSLCVCECVCTHTLTTIAIHVCTLILCLPLSCNKNILLCCTALIERCISINMTVHWTRRNTPKLLLCRLISGDVLEASHPGKVRTDGEDGQRAIVHYQPPLCSVEALEDPVLHGSTPEPALPVVTAPLHHRLLMSRTVKSMPAFPRDAVSVPTCHTPSATVSRLRSVSAPSF